MPDRILHVGHSPDPDDAFMFYGLSSGKVKLDGIAIEHVLEDIQSLNRRALAGELEITAVSAHAFPLLADRYWLMETGASMGEGYGPVLVARAARTLADLRGRRVAHPGRLTTAFLLLQLYLDPFEAVELPFDRITEAVLSGAVDAGVLIHEGQITYAEAGLARVLDFGQAWEAETGGLPLPLGLDVVRKDLGEDLARRLSGGLRESIRYGYAHPDEAVPYALRFGRGIDRALGERFVKMYVSELTIAMGGRGRAALDRLFARAHAQGLLPAVAPVSTV